jgi:hypothetical protein
MEKQRIPWAYIKVFMKGLHEQYKIMASYQDHVDNDEAMPVKVAEVLFSKPMNKLFQSLTTVLKDNKVLTAEDL